jgi:hypothetical protein
MPKNPIELPCFFGDHFNTIVPVATSPTLVSAAQVTAFVVFKCATYLPENTPFVQPDTDPLIEMFCTVGLSLNPGESFIVPPLPLQLVPSRLADAADAPSSVVADDTPKSTAAYASFLRFTRFASSYLVRGLRSHGARLSIPLTRPRRQGWQWRGSEDETEEIVEWV